jgi:hypothetical protein
VNEQVIQRFDVVREKPMALACDPSTSSGSPAIRWPA